ncbi:basic salivary proline-rich protein 2-like [Panicum miliaceum]|uniref:Basic salivary proline-rich protein 2-like n=1 Tax=Panicum miliaceum TaxID=4540 RepID=A0A3L6RL81_PANMI|nr:basic salivary proline-rich protein 2-like [Panicum miliaceum]
MSKQPVSPEGGGGVPLTPSRARGADAAPSPPGTGRTRKASVQGEGQAAAGSSLRDGAGTSAAMAAHGGDGRRVTLLVPPQDGGQPQQHTPARAGLGDEAAPPHGGSPTAPEGPRRFGLPTAKPIERVSTLETGYGTEAPAPADSRLPPVPPPHARPQQPTPPYQPPPYGKKWQASPMLPTERRRKKENSKKPLAILFTLCCILFWLLVVCIGLAILVIYLLYHPKPPRLHVSTATLNAGYIDELPPPHLGQALNSDLYVLAAIYNPNTKIDVVLHYMQFDLYFQGHLIGTQAVWPPLYERPGDSALRTVHLVVSEVMMRPEDAEVWKNVTASGGLVQMQLEGRFYVQLNFGRWLPFRYMVKPSCALWLDPPPAGALRRARCRQ